MALALTVTLGIGVVAQTAVAQGPLEGVVKFYFSEHDGTTNSITIDLGAGPVATGPLITTLDLTFPENSFEAFDFDNMTVVEEVDVLLTNDLLKAAGLDPIKIHAVERGTFVVNEVVEGPDGFLYDISTTLSGHVVVPPGSPFEGWTWINAKEQTVSAGVSVDPDGTVTGTVSKSWSTKDASVVSPDLGGGSITYPIEGLGNAKLSTSPVPEPSSLFLLSSALIGIAVLRRRRNS